MRYTCRQLWWMYLNGEVGLPIALVLAGTVFTLLGGFGFYREARWQVDGVRVAAVVQGKHVAGSGGRLVVASLLAHGGRDRRPWVLYRYQDAAGAWHDGKDRIDADVWQGLAPGDRVEIEYLASDPETSRVPSRVWYGLVFTFVFSLFSLAILGVGVVGGVSGLLAISREVRLIAEGEPTVGLVERVGIYRSDKTLHYRYLGADDRGEPTLVTGETRALPRRVRDRWAANDPVLILVDPRDPTRHAVDVFEARRADLDVLLSEPSAAPAPSPLPPADGC